MKLRELIEHLQSLTDDMESEVFVQMLPVGGGSARPTDPSGPVQRVLSGDYRSEFGVGLGVYIEATEERPDA